MDRELLQPKNAFSPIFVDLGIVIADRLLQPLNVPPSILVTELGIVMDDRLLQPQNA